MQLHPVPTQVLASKENAMHAISMDTSLVIVHLKQDNGRIHYSATIAKGLAICLEIALRAIAILGETKRNHIVGGGVAAL